MKMWSGVVVCMVPTRRGPGLGEIHEPDGDTGPPQFDGRDAVRPTITVVYDPESPSRVLTPDQLDDGHARLNATMGWVFIAVAAVGLLW